MTKVFLRQESGTLIQEKNIQRPEDAKTLRITEIFYSLQGETNTMGLPTVFIRLTGCPLRCQYCDTAYAFHGGKRQTIDDILSQTLAYKARYVTVTGGEPLAQRRVHVLLKRLADAGFIVSLETSGALSIEEVDDRVIKVVDIKTPSSMEVEKNLWSNLKYIKPHDQLKFVICNRQDYEWAKGMLDQYHLTSFQVLFSPSAQEQDPRQLAEWILEDHLPVRFQIQLHKYLWDNMPGR